MAVGELPFFAQMQPAPKEGTASITTRLPLGTIFESRDYIFSTATNVRSYEWTLKEAEELLDDLLDASSGIFPSDLPKQDYELSQIVLVPMEWDRELYGLGNRYDVHDGQQRLVTLCLLFAALRESFANDEGMDDTAMELANMLNPPKVRKADVVRIELNKRDNEVLVHILKNDLKELDHLNLKKLTKANQRIYENYKQYVARIDEMEKSEKVKFLDYLVENVYMLVCIPESATIARSLVMSQGKGKDNEPIDDFKGLVCFRYTSDEDNMYRTFDAWDKLAAVSDLDNGSVGRNTVSDACLLRATAELRTKIRKRDQVYSLERWLRMYVVENKHEGHVFYKKKVEPASLLLGQYREGTFNLFGFYARSKGAQVWKSIVMRLRFLRELTNTIPAVKEVEVVVLELLLRAGASEGSKPMSLPDLDRYLHEVEQLALWMALVKPSATYLDKIYDDKKNDIQVISQEDKSSLREALVITEFGSSASGKKIAIALLKRLNAFVLAQEDGKDDAIMSSMETYLESILPIQGSKKAWGDSWPDPNERDKWVNRLGNLAILNSKATAREAKMAFADKKKEEAKMAFADKKKRYTNEIYPLTSKLANMEEWNSTNLVKHLAS
eukprot:CAMPEP_0176505286 /NCGR_PEP_ID=MMETSP0200_2-20121128/16411_1 /TAXON_ID=947934 /ORGANISM="Chaetoceros sp., Strain GSL56" /LENGTH=612 /DNA_ID=CAMNT_0017904825 /DNA_START=359 /DNA_END=2195 /DNA_ORIENTATION=+